MHRSFATLAAALIAIAAAPLDAADEAGAEKDAPAQVIRWTGSAYDDGDAFIVTARIFPARVEMHWDGFVSSLRFMVDSTLEKPPRLQKDYLFTDPTTVQAFRTLAAQAVEQCNPGPSMVLGTGISTDVVVESPAGKEVGEVKYFDTPPHLLKAACLEGIPFQVRAMVKREGPALVPAEDLLSASLHALSAELSRADDCHQKLLAAYKAGADLPVKALETLRVPAPLAEALALRNDRGQDGERARKLLGTAEKLLADCLGPARIASFSPSGEGRGEGGVLVAVQSAVFATDHEFITIPQECLPAKLGKAEQSPVPLPRELEEVLVRFMAAPAMAEHDASGKTRLRLPVGVVYDLGISASGKLELGLSEKARRLNIPGGLPEIDLNPTLKQAELQTRLEYLNSKGIVGLLLGREPAAGKVPALIRIESLRIYAEDLSRARIEFLRDDTRRLEEVHLVEGQWMPLKPQALREYQGEEQDSPFGEDGRDPFTEDDQSKSK